MDFTSESHHSIIRPVESDNSLSPRIDPSNQNHVTNKVCFVFFFLSLFFRSLTLFELCIRGTFYFLFIDG
jgi:hypothetical protein